MKYAMNGLNGMMLIVALTLWGGASMASAQDGCTGGPKCPHIVFPFDDRITTISANPLDDEINQVQWMVEIPPTVQYVLAINKVQDDDNDGVFEPVVGPNAVAKEFQPNDPRLTNLGNNLYSFEFNYAIELAELGSGFYRLGLAAIDDVDIIVAQPVIFQLLAAIPRIDLINGEDPERIEFALTVIDEADRPDYRYVIRFTDQQTNQVFEYEISKTEKTATRDDFPQNIEADLTNGHDFLFEFQVQDSVGTGLEGFLSDPDSELFHFNDFPQIDVFQFNGIQPDSENFRVYPRFESGGTPTQGPFSIHVSDDQATNSFTILLADSNVNFPPLADGAFTPAVTHIIPTSETVQRTAPFDAAGYYKARAVATDPFGFPNQDPLSAFELNILINDQPITAYLSPNDGTRFDYSLNPGDPAEGMFDIAQNQGLVDFEAQTATDNFPAGGDLAYEWIFGDGNEDVLLNDPTTTHIYEEPGIYFTRLIVTDEYDLVNRDHPLTRFITLNDRPFLELNRIFPGRKNTPSTFEVPLSANPVEFHWTRYNFLTDGPDGFEFSFTRTGTTEVCDRRGVANVEDPTPGNTDFVSTDPLLGADIADLGTFSTTLDVPGAERNGPITEVTIKQLIFEQRYNDAATDLCGDGPTITPSAGPFTVSTLGAADDGLSTCDADSVTSASDLCTTPPLLAPGQFVIDLAGATPDGEATCDLQTVGAATDLCTSAPMALPSTYAIDVNAAFADGLSLLDSTTLGTIADTCGGVPLISPGAAVGVDLTGFDATGVSSCDAFAALFSDLCIAATPIAPGTLAVNTAALAADGLASCELNIPFTDLCTDARLAAPGAYSVDLTAASGEGISSCETGVVGVATDDCGDAQLVASDATISINLAAATPDGISSCDPIAESAADLCTSGTVIAPGTHSVDTAAFTGDGLSSCEDAAAQDDCADAELVAPGTYALDLGAATADGVSTCDILTTDPTDLCTAGPFITPGTQTIDPILALTRVGESACDNLANQADACTDAEPIGLGVYSGDTTGQTPEGISACDDGTAPAVWFSYTSAIDGVTTFTLTGEPADGFTSTSLAVYVTCPPAVELDCTSGSTAVLAVAATSDTTFLIRISGVDATQFGRYTLEVEGTPSAEQVAHPDVYYRYRPQADGNASIALSGSTDATVLSVHTDVCPPTSNTTIACDVTTGGVQAQVNFAVTAGTTYLIRTAADPDDAPFDLELTGPETRRDVWFAYTPVEDGPATFTLSDASVDAVLSIHSDCPGDSANTIACSAIDSGTSTQLALNVTAGTSYQVRVAAASDDADLNLTLDVAGPAVRRDGWFQYTPQENGNFTARLIGSDPGTVLSIHSGCPGTVGNTLDCDVTNGGQATSTLAATAGTSYWIRVATPEGATDTYSLRLDGPQIRPDQWFQFQPQANGQTTIALSGSPDGAILSVHDDCPGTTESEIACAPTVGATQAEVSFFANKNKTYRIRAAAENPAATFSVALSDAPPARRDAYLRYAPVADGPATFTLTNAVVDTVLSIHSACPAAAANTIACDVIGAGTSTTLALAEATSDTTYYIRVASPIDLSDLAYDVEIEGPPVRRDGWVSYTPQGDGFATFSLSGSDVETALSVHSGCPGDLGTELGCDLTSVSQATVSIAVTSGTTYLVRFATPAGAADVYDLNIDGPNVRRDGFFRYTPTADGNATVTLSDAAAGAVLSVHSACPATVGNEIDCVALGGASGQVSFPVSANTDYYLRVASPADDSDLQMSLDVVGPNVRKDAYYRYVPSAAGMASFMLSGSEAGSIVSIHSGCPATTNSQVAASLTSTSQAMVMMPVTTDTLYVVRLAAPAGVGGATTNFDVMLDGPTPLRDVWYRYTPVSAGNATFALPDAPSGAILSLHEDCPGTIGNQLDCDFVNGSPASVTLPVIAGEDYYVRVAGSADVATTFTLDVDGPNTRRDVWFTYMPAFDGNALFALNESDPGTILSVHAGCPGTTSTQAGCDVTAEEDQAGVNVAVTSDTTYVVRLATPWGFDDSFELTLDGPEAKSWLNDLTVTLTAPNGTSTTLFNQGVCDLPYDESIPLELDEDALLSIVSDACPLTTDTGNVFRYRPAGNLAVFDGVEPDGTWTLQVSDGANKNVGRLVGWALQICTIEQIPPQGDTILNSSDEEIVQGVFEHLFKVPGTYSFTFDPPTEIFDGDVVTGEVGGPFTVNVVDPDVFDVGNPTGSEWILYR